MERAIGDPTRVRLCHSSSDLLEGNGPVFQSERIASVLRPSRRRQGDSDKKNKHNRPAVVHTVLPGSDGHAFVFGSLFIGLAAAYHGGLLSTAAATAVL
jgi:hypothetical protein